MGLRAQLKNSNAWRGLVQDAKTFYYKSKGGPHVVDAYLRNHPVRKLQLGSGNNDRPGWLSTDIAPAGRGVSFAYLDATKPFPIPSGTFDFIYSEHVIEHIPWHAGNLMVSECRRILRDSGVIRIATPNAGTLLELYGKSEDPAAEAYLRWIADRYLRSVGSCKPLFVINNAFRNWGHQFLYDKELLVDSLDRAGFSEIVECAYGESRHEALRGIERHGEFVGNDAGVRYETMIFEARK